MRAVCFWVLAVLTVGLIVTASANAQSSETVTWQALPFPTDSDWPGPKGQSASISGDEVILQGQPARTVETYQLPLSIDCDVSVDARFADDGSFGLHFVSPGEPLDKNIRPAVFFFMIYRNPGAYSGLDELSIFNNDSAGYVTNPWNFSPFSIHAADNYHVHVDVAASGELSVSINGLSYGLPARTVVPFPQFQLQIAGWQPTNVWRVRNFRVKSVIASSECVLTCPDDVVVVAAPNEISAVVNYPAPGITGDCDPASVASVPASGSLFEIGTTTVTCTASNADGQIAQCTFQVTVSPSPLPCATILALIERVTGLDLQAGLINALTSKLEAAQASLERSNNRACANQLRAFINQVSAMKKTATLDAAKADELIACARSLQPVSVRKHRRGK